MVGRTYLAAAAAAVFLVSSPVIKAKLSDTFAVDPSDMFSGITDIVASQMDVATMAQNLDISAFDDNWINSFKANKDVLAKIGIDELDLMIKAIKASPSFGNRPRTVDELLHGASGSRRKLQSGQLVTDFAGSVLQTTELFSKPEEDMQKYMNFLAKGETESTKKILSRLASGDLSSFDEGIQLARGARNGLTEAEQRAVLDKTKNDVNSDAKTSAAYRSFVKKNEEFKATNNHLGAKNKILNDMLTNEEVFKSTIKSANKLAEAMLDEKALKN